MPPTVGSFVKAEVTCASLVIDGQRKKLGPTNTSFTVIGQLMSFDGDEYVVRPVLDASHAIDFEFTTDDVTGAGVVEL